MVAQWQDLCQNYTFTWRNSFRNTSCKGPLCILLASLFCSGYSISISYAPGSLWSASWLRNRTAFISLPHYSLAVSLASYLISYIIFFSFGKISSYWRNNKLVKNAIFAANGINWTTINKCCVIMAKLPNLFEPWDPLTTKCSEQSHIHYKVTVRI